MKIYVDNAPKNCNHCIYRENVSRCLDLEDYCSKNMKNTSKINMETDCPLRESNVRKYLTHTSHTKIRHTTRNYATLGIWKRFFQFSGSLLIKRDTSSVIWHSDAL